MTPKEKAKELVDKFENYVETEDFFGDSRVLENSKQCALIAVDEILNVLEEIPDLKVEGNILLDKIEYYKGVRTEIEKL